jgi:hypothetical protein
VGLSGVGCGVVAMMDLPEASDGELDAEECLALGPATP